jgi:phosphoribosylformylglycinamidine synthase
MPRVDLALAPKAAACVATLISQGIVHSAHDCSEGGLLVSIAEMLIGARDRDAGIGCEVHASVFGNDGATNATSTAHPTATPAQVDAFAKAFHEAPTRYVLEVAIADVQRVTAAADKAGLACEQVGTLNAAANPALSWRVGDGSLSVPVDELLKAWRGTLDW